MSRSPSRRQFLSGGVAFLGGATAGAVAGATYANADDQSEAASTGLPWGQDTIAFWGAHQPGVETPPQSHAVFVALDLHNDADRESTERLLRLWTDDAARLMSGEGALADMEPELAAHPSQLTVTYGFGPTFFTRLGLAASQPKGLVKVPPLPIDQLQERWSGGDLLIQVGCDDLVTLSHALRVLLRDGRDFADVRWVQRGFREARGAVQPGTTPRNLLGQVDGTVNPTPGSLDFDSLVWASSDHPWFAGGTTVVLRRIAFNLDDWDALDRSDRELAIGRRLADGAPLTGGDEQTPADFKAVDENGLKVIPEFAHIRRATARRPHERFLRRGYSYDDSLSAGSSISDSGLVFCSYQADVGRQFIPVQRRLAELDLLNRWTTPIGSAVFALPPGVNEGGWIGQSLLA